MSEGIFFHDWFFGDYFVNDFFGGPVSGVEGTWVSSDVLSGKVLVVETGYFEKRMWGLLSEQARREDGGSETGVSNV